DPTDNDYTKWIQVLGEKITTKVSEAQESFDEANTKYQQSINSISQALSGEFQNYLNVLEGSGSKVENTTRKLFDALASVSASSGKTQFNTQEIEKIFNIFKSSTIKNVEDAQTAFNKLPNPIKLTGEELKVLDQALKQATFGTYTDETDSFTGAT